MSEYLSKQKSESVRRAGAGRYARCGDYVISDVSLLLLSHARNMVRKEQRSKYDARACANTDIENKQNEFHSISIFNEAVAFSDLVVVIRQRSTPNNHQINNAFVVFPALRMRGQTHLHTCHIPRLLRNVRFSVSLFV